MRTLSDSDPRHIGRYRLLRELGRGGMGRVLLAVDPAARLAAVKVIHEQFLDDREFRARFRREVDAARRVTSRSTAALLDADPDAEIPWSASEFCHGPTLRQAVDDHGALPGGAPLRLAAGLLEALSAIHSAGLVHRDLRPANVILVPGGVKVIDFGIVRAIDGSNTTELTHTGGIIGSPAFMSPEQASGGEVTAAGDVFSFGSVLYTAATGRDAFTGAGIPQIMFQVVHGEPDLAPVPPRIRDLVADCLAKSPQARPTVEQLLNRLDHVAVGARPWPDSVRLATSAQRAAITEALAEAGTADGDGGTSRWPDGETVSLDDEPPRAAHDDGGGVADGGGPADAGGAGTEDPGGPVFDVGGAGVPGGGGGAPGPGTPGGPPGFGPPAPGGPGRRPGTSTVHRSAALRQLLLAAAAVVALLIVTGLIATAADSASEDDAGPSSESPSTVDTPSDTWPEDDVSSVEPDPEVFPDATVGDCVEKIGDDADLEFADCEDGVFEVVDILDADEHDDCFDRSDVDWTVWRDSADMALCLSYRHPTEIYHAEPDDCVDYDGDVWSYSDCSVGTLTVLERLTDETDEGNCEDSWRFDWSLPLTVSAEDGLDIVLCMSMNYPDDAGHAVVDNCLLMTKYSSGDRTFEFADCSDSNVVVVGRGSDPDDKSFCGDYGWTSWRAPEQFEESSYIVCWDWL